MNDFYFIFLLHGFEKVNKIKSINSMEYQKNVGFLESTHVHSKLTLFKRKLLLSNSWGAATRSIGQQKRGLLLP